jgi:hypothetical protein
MELMSLEIFFQKELKGDQLLNKHHKDKYHETFIIVEKIVNEWDPVDVLAFDCPDDEYEFEILRIVSATLSVNNAE